MNHDDIIKDDFDFRVKFVMIHLTSNLLGFNKTTAQSYLLILLKSLQILAFFKNYWGKFAFSFRGVQNQNKEFKKMENIQDFVKFLPQTQVSKCLEWSG